LLLLFGALGFYAFTLLIQQSVPSKRGSFTYYVTIQSRLIKSFPEIGNVRDVTYWYNCQDGTAPWYNEIDYQTDADKSAILRAVDRFLRSNGFQRHSDAWYFEFGYSKGETKFYVSVDYVEGGRWRVAARECRFR
jgi:hypothetical protein